VRPDRVGFHVSAFGSENVLAALSATAKAGFAAVEIYADTMLIFADRPDEFREIMDISGMEIGGIHSGGMLTDPEFHEAEAAVWQRIFEWTAAVGGEYAVYYGGERSHDPLLDLECSVRLLTDLGTRAKKLGVTFCYEPDARSPFRSRQSLARLLKETDPSLVKLSVDTAHLARTEVDPALFIAMHKQRIHVVHVRDIRKPETPDLSRDGFVDPGDGIVDLVAVGETLRALGYEGWIVGVVARPHVAPHRSVDRTARYFREAMGITLPA
jgi:sugar phosphate isomerase/epimerase